MNEQPVNRRSDVDAKRAFCEHLSKLGFENVRITASPTDIRGSKDGADWLYEVKYTDANLICFGAATLTEWAAAAIDPEHFRFVIAYRDNEQWQFDSYTPEQFMEYSSVPPFKLYFSVPIRGSKRKVSALPSRRIMLTKKRLALLTQQFSALRSLEDEGLPTTLPIN